MSVIKERIVAYGYGSLSPSYFCVHSTANPGATAANHASLWSREPLYAVHLVSDWTECLHTVPYDALCYQVGNGNAYVEGLEICEATTGADFERGIKIAADVVRERLKAHGWGADRLITHHTATQWWGGSDHTDPDPYFAKWGYSWDAFVRLVKQGDEDMTPNDIWNYKLGSEGKSNYKNVPAWQHLSYAHYDTARMYKLLTQTDDLAAQEGEKEYAGNIFSRICYIDKRVREMYAEIPALTEAVRALSSAVGADPDEIVAAVDKAVRDRLAELEVTFEVKGEDEAE